MQKNWRNWNVFKTSNFFQLSFIIITVFFSQYFSRPNFLLIILLWRKHVCKKQNVAMRVARRYIKYEDID